MENEVEVTDEEMQELAEVETPDVEEGPVEEVEEAPAVRSNYRNTHRQVAHVPGPRRKRKFAKPPVQVVEDDTVAAAPAEAKVSAEDTQGFEKPITLGSVDG